MSVIFDTTGLSLSGGSKSQLPFPPLLANNLVVGFDVQNFLPFDITIFGIPGASVYKLQPYTGMFIPVPFAQTPVLLQPLQSSVLVIQVGTIPWFLFNIAANQAFAGGVTFTAFLDGDPLPTNALIPYILPVPQLGPQNQFHRSASIITVATNYADSVSARTTTTGPFALTNTPFSGLYLIALGFSFFEIASTTVHELCTLTDINGTIIQEWDAALGSALIALPPYKADIVYGWPGILSNGASGGNQSWTFNTPATASGPGYSVYLYCYAI